MFQLSDGEVAGNRRLGLHKSGCIRRERSVCVTTSSAPNSHTALGTRASAPRGLGERAVCLATEGR
jgi:hypothetical protein